MNIDPDHAPAPPRPSAWCCPSSRASWTATRMRVPVPDRLGHRPDRRSWPGTTGKDEVNAAMQGRRRGPAARATCDYTEDPIVSSDIVDRPGVVHLRRRADQRRSATRSRSSAGTTTSGATPTAWSTWSRSSAPRSRRRRAHGRRPGRRWASGCWSAPTSTCRCDGRHDHRRRPDPGQRCRPSRRSPAGARGSSSAPTWAGRRARPGPGVLAARRWPHRLGELLGRPVAFASDIVGDRAHEPPSTAWPTARSPLLENVRFDAAGDQSKDDAERGRAGRRRWPRWPTLYVSDGFGVVHRKQASVYDVARLLPHAAGGLVSTEVAGAAPAHRATRSGPTSSCSAGRRSPTSSAVIGEPARQGRPAARRRRHVLHLPGGPGPRGRATRCSRPTRSTPAGASWTQAAGARGRDRAARRRRGRPGFAAGRRDTEVVAGGRDPGRAGRAWTSARTPWRCSRAELADAAHRVLERPDGRVRARRRSPRAPGRSPRRITDVDGLTVVGGGDSAAAVRALGFAEDALHAHLHRRRAPPGVPRGQDAARPRRARGGLTA